MWLFILYSCILGIMCQSEGVFGRYRFTLAAGLQGSNGVTKVEVYRRMATWAEAVDTCRRQSSSLLCYTNDRHVSQVAAELTFLTMPKMWIRNRNCSKPISEPNLSVDLKRFSRFQNESHHRFQKELATEKLPFICIANKSSENGPSSLVYAAPGVAANNETSSGDIIDTTTSKSVFRNEEGVATCFDINPGSKVTWEEFCARDFRSTCEVSQNGPMCKTKTCKDIRSQEMTWENFCIKDDKRCVQDKEGPRCEAKTCSDRESEEMTWREACEKSGKKCVEYVDGPRCEVPTCADKHSSGMIWKDYCGSKFRFICEDSEKGPNCRAQTCDDEHSKGISWKAYCDSQPGFMCEQDEKGSRCKDTNPDPETTTADSDIPKIITDELFLITSASDWNNAKYQCEKHSGRLACGELINKNFEILSSMNNYFWFSGTYSCGPERSESGCSFAILHVEDNKYSEDCSKDSKYYPALCEVQKGTSSGQTTSTVITTTTPKMGSPVNITDKLFYIQNVRDWSAAKYQCEKYSGRLACGNEIPGIVKMLASVSNFFWFSGDHFCGSERSESGCAYAILHVEEGKFSDGCSKDSKYYPALCEVQERTSPVPTTTVMTTPKQNLPVNITEKLFWILDMSSWHDAKSGCEKYSGRLACGGIIDSNMKNISSYKHDRFWFSGSPDCGLKRYETEYSLAVLEQDGNKFRVELSKNTNEHFPALCEVFEYIGHPFISTENQNWENAAKYCADHGGQLACHGSKFEDFVRLFYEEIRAIAEKGVLLLWYGGPCGQASKDGPYSVEIVVRDGLIVREIESKEDKRVLCELPRYTPTTSPVPTTTVMTTPKLILPDKITEKLFWMPVMSSWHDAKGWCEKHSGRLACGGIIDSNWRNISIYKHDRFWFSGNPDCGLKRYEIGYSLAVLQKEGDRYRMERSENEHFPALCEVFEYIGFPIISPENHTWDKAAQYCEQYQGRLACLGPNFEDFLRLIYKDITAIADKGVLVLWYSGPCGQASKERPYSVEITLREGDSLEVREIESKENKRVLCEFLRDTSTTTTAVTTTTSTTTTTTTTRTTTTTTTRTTMKTTTTVAKPICCKETKSRGILWKTQCTGDLVYEECPDGAKGQATWSCDLFKGTWTPSTPDLEDCVSDFIEQLESSVNSSNVPDALEKLTKEPPRFGGDILGIGKILTEVVSNAQTYIDSVEDTGAKKDLALNITDKVATLGDNILSNKTVWKDLSNTKRTKAATDLLQDGEKTAFLCANNLGAKEMQHIEKNTFTLQVMKDNKGAFSEGLVLPRSHSDDSSPEGASQKSKFELPADFDKSLSGGDGQHVTIVFFEYKDLGDILVVNNDEKSDNESASSLRVNSPVISVSLNDDTAKVKLEKEAYFVVRHIGLNSTRPNCSYWNTTNLNWDTDGCRLVGSNDTFTECACNHLTNFAVLMDVQNALEGLTHDDLENLKKITIIGCIISIVFLSATIAITIIYRALRGMRTSVHRNLCICLLIAEIIFVSSASRTEMKLYCSIVAGLLHYFFTAAFCWMFLESVVIYLLLYKVFSPKKSYTKKFYAFGYGVPLLIVAISAASRPSGYGTENACWLSIENGFRWSFMGPIAFILAVNTIALIYALRIAIKTNKKMNSKTGPPVNRTWILGALTLVPLLGSTWIIGFFLLKNEPVLVYTFTILNSLQGLAIFIVQCLLNQSSRKCLLKSLGKYTSLVSATSLSSSARRSTTNTDARQNNGHSAVNRKTSSTSVRVVPVTSPDGQTPNKDRRKSSQGFLRNLSSQPNSFDFRNGDHTNSDEVRYSASVEDISNLSPTVVLKNTHKNEACF